MTPPVLLNPYILGAATPAISLVGVTTATGSSGSGSITPHASAVAGDMALVILGSHYAPSTTYEPSGWKPVGPLAGGSFQNGKAFYKKLTSGDLGVGVTTAFSGSENWSIVCLVYRNVLSVSFQGYTIGRGSEGAGTVLSIPTVGCVAGDVSVHAVFSRNNTAPTISTGTTQASQAGDVSYRVNDEPWTVDTSPVLAQAASQGHFAAQFTLRATTSDVYRNTILADMPSAYYRSAASGFGYIPNIGGGLAGQMQIAGAASAGGSAPKAGSSSISWTTSLGYAISGYCLAPLTSRNYTIEAWVYYSGAPGSYTTIFGNGTSYNSTANTETSLGINTSGQPTFYCYNIGTLTGSAALSTGVWHHLVGVIDLSGSVRMRLRVDKSTVASQSTGTPGTSDRNLFIRGSGSQTTTGGALLTAECALYDTPLTDTRIDAHYDAA